MNLPTTDEEQLITLAQAGNQDAFNTLISLHRQPLFEYAVSALGDSDDAEDAVQNTLIFAWFNFKSYVHTPGKFRRWLLASCKNHNRHVREGRAYEDSAWYDNHSTDIESVSPLWTSVSNPFPTFDDAEIDQHNKEKLDAINAKLESLPYTQKEVFILHRDGRTTSDIATALGISKPSVRKALYRARIRLGIRTRVKKRRRHNKPKPTSSRDD